MDAQNWLFLLPDGTEAVVRVLTPETADRAAVFSERAELTASGDQSSWRIGFVLAGSGDLDGRRYQCLARVEKRED